MTKFSDLALDPRVLQAVTDAGYETPTPIQAQAIPPALLRQDVLGIAQTGTGKTASFVLPMITLLGQGRARARMPRSLVLAPTRELAAQVAENFDTYAKHTKLTKALLIGGVSFGEQDKLIDRGVDVLIATPGRLLDHHERGKLLLTGVELKRFFWRHDGVPLNYHPAHRPRRQEFAGTVMENGAFYFTRTALLRASGVRLGGRIGVHVMAAECAAELDEPDDWPIVEALLRPRVVAGRDLRLLVVDVDGTLTDGGMYYDSKGEAMKKFDTRDAKGMLMLRDAGVRVCVVTAETSAVVTARMRKLGITDYFPGVKDKLAWLREHLTHWQLDAAQVAYIGDDLNDLEGLLVAGLSCCPADAVPEVRQAVHYVCAAGGGAGAVREVCDLVRTQ